MDGISILSFLLVMHLFAVGYSRKEYLLMSTGIGKSGTHSQTNKQTDEQ